MRLKIYTFLFIFLSSCFQFSFSQDNCAELIKKYNEKYNYGNLPQSIPIIDSVLSVVGRWAWGSCFAVAIKDTLACIGNGPSIHILNISDPKNPVFISEFITNGIVYDIKVDEGKIFSTVGSGLLILDITIPSEPQLISFINLNEILTGLSLGQDFAYVVSFFGNVHVIDLSDIYYPYQRGQIYLNEQCSSIDALNGFIYLSNLELPLFYIVDATNPDNLFKKQVVINGYSTSVSVTDSILCVASHSSSGKLRTYSIKNQWNPEILGEITIQDSLFIEGLIISENNSYVYCLSSSTNPFFTEGIFAIDISDPAAPLKKFKLERESAAIGGNLDLSSNILLAPFVTGTSIISIAKPDSLSEEKFWSTSHHSEDVSINNSILYIASGLAGVWITDIINPDRIIPITNLQTGSYTAKVIVQDSLLYFLNYAVGMADTSRSLWIASTANPEIPKILSHYIGSIQPFGLYENKGFIYLTRAAATSSITTVVEIINVKNPYQPDREAIIEGDYRIFDAAFYDSILYLATSHGLRIFNISDPANPTEVNVVQSTENFRALKINNHLLFTAISDRLLVFNLTNPYQPILVADRSGIFSDINYLHFSISEPFLYWTERNLGIIDFTNPSLPLELQTVMASDVAKGVISQNNLVIFADNTQGVWILRNGLISGSEGKEIFISEFSLEQNFPNPFNGSTQLVFSMPYRELIKIELFNLLGEKVGIILEGEYNQGRHTINFNADEFPSGIYFYRLTVKDRSTIKKMVLIK